MYFINAFLYFGANCKMRLFERDALLEPYVRFVGQRACACLKLRNAELKAYMCRRNVREIVGAPHRYFTFVNRMTWYQNIPRDELSPKV